MVLTFGSKDGILASDHSYKNVILRMSSALLLYRLSCMLYTVFLTFESVGEILKFKHSNESYWAVLFMFYKVVLALSLWSFKRKILGCTFLWYCLLCRTRFKGTGSRFRACSFMKMLFSAATCCIASANNMIMSKWCQRTNLHVHSPGSHLINLCANNCKLINHGINGLRVNNKFNVGSVGIIH